MLNREAAIKKIFHRHGKDALYITNTGYNSRAVYNLYPENKNILYMQGSMGLSPAIGIGLALNLERDIVVFVGDGSLLMHMGLTHTLRDLNCSNLYVYVLDNGCHESVGAYECSPLEDNYPGITEVIKISNDGKQDRVGIGCEENLASIRSFIGSRNA